MIIARLTLEKCFIHNDIGLTIKLWDGPTFRIKLYLLQLFVVYKGSRIGRRYRKKDRQCIILPPLSFKVLSDFISLQMSGGVVVQHLEKPPNSRRRMMMLPSFMSK